MGACALLVGWWAFTLLVFRLFPHKDVPRDELFTLASCEASSDEWEDTQTDCFEDDMGVSSIAQVCEGGNAVRSKYNAKSVNGYSRSAG